MQVWSDIFLSLMDTLKWVRGRLGRLQHPLALLLGRELFDRQVAPALQGQGVGSVKDCFHPVDPDRRIFNVPPDSVGVNLEQIERQFGPCALERKIVPEEIDRKSTRL